jgi:sugar lactone lactonase YvrE
MNILDFISFIYMKFYIMKNYLIALLILLVNSSFSQCITGQRSVSLVVTTDDYGYEGYWELTSSANTCGNLTIANGGNLTVGCVAGTQNQDPSGYANNTVYNEGPWCLTDGAFYTIHYRDDWGDGGFQFRILIDGQIAHEFTDMELGTDFTFQVSEPLAHDLACYTWLNSTLVQGRYVQQEANYLKLLLYNYGVDTVHAAGITYSVNGAEPVYDLIIGLDIVPYESEVVSHPIPWIPSQNGLYTIDFKITTVNGYDDQDTLNNSASAQYEVGPGRPNMMDSYLTGVPTFTLIADASNAISQPTDLDFHPRLSTKQLWVVNKGTENTGGSTVTITNTGQVNQTTELLQDGNAWHFMSLPTGIEFSDNGNFATSPGVFDANHAGTANAFTGPTLWSSDPQIYAQPSGGNGSHIDMLHESPNSQGICWEKDNTFWLFDGFNNDIVRYDFVNDHNPGFSDHSDAIVRRYSDTEVLRDVNGTVSHMAFDNTKTWLYVVDNGHQRVFRMDITSGNTSLTAPAYGPHESMSEYVTITGYTWENVVTTGLQDPAGIVIDGNIMVVTDHQTNELIFYNISSIPATEIRRVSANTQGIMGVTIGPDGLLYYVDNAGNKVIRLNPSENPLSIDENLQNDIQLFPNPSKGLLGFTSNSISGKLTIEIYTLEGKKVSDLETESGKLTNTGLSAGCYILKMLNKQGLELKRMTWIVN